MEHLVPAQPLHHRSNHPCRNIRLDLLGLAAATGSGSGPGRSKKSAADQAGTERVEGGGYGEASPDGPETKGCGVGGGWRHSWSHPRVPLGYSAAPRLHYVGERRGSVAGVRESVMVEVPSHAATNPQQHVLQYRECQGPS
jgi:hypothetical protein